jgi:hypothetical protein
MLTHCIFCGQDECAMFLVWMLIFIAELTSGLYHLMGMTDPNPDSAWSCTYAYLLRPFIAEVTCVVCVVFGVACL